MPKAIIGLCIAIVVLLSLITSTTWTYFNDTESSSNNTFTAGTLDLVPLVTGSYSGLASLYHIVAGGNGVNGNVVFDKIAPGQNGTIEWVLSNTGKLAGTLSIACTTIFAENGSSELESLATGNNGGSNGDLDQYLLVTLQRGVGTDQASAEAAMTYILGTVSSPVAISGLEAVLDAQNQALAASGGNDTVVYQLTWSLSSSDPNINIVQSDTAQIDITFTLSQ